MLYKLDPTPTLKLYRTWTRRVATFKTQGKVASHARACALLQSMARAPM